MFLQKTETLRVFGYGHICSWLSVWYLWTLSSIMSRRTVKGALILFHEQIWDDLRSKAKRTYPFEFVTTVVQSGYIHFSAQAWQYSADPRKSPDLIVCCYAWLCF